MDTERFDALEQRVHDLEAEVAGLRTGSRPVPERMPPRPVAASPHPVAVSPSLAAPRPPRPAPQPIPPRPQLTLEDVLSPRNLAAAGALAVFIGLAFLVSLGISNGWINETVRVAGAGLLSLALIAAGLFARERRQINEPAQAMVVAGAAGLFVALVAATRLYSLLDPAPALASAGLIGLFGVLVGLRWRREIVAGSILCAALIAPLLIGAAYTVGLLVFLIPVFVVAVAGAILRPWATTFTVAAALFLTSLIACVVAAEGGSTLAAFALAGLTLILCVAGSAGRLLWKNTEVENAQPVLYGVFVAAATVLGMFLVGGSDAPLGGCGVSGVSLVGCDPAFANWAAAWFIFSAAVGGAVWWAAHERGREALAITAFSLATAAIATTLAFLFHGGPLLAVAWSVQAACLIAFGRTVWQSWVGYAVLILAVIAALIEVPPGLLADGSNELVRDLVTAGSLLIPFGAMVWKGEEAVRDWGWVLVVTIGAWLGLLTVGALIATDSVLNLIPLALAAGVPVALTRRDWPLFTFAGFGFAAITFTLLTTVPPEALVDGVPSAREAVMTGVILALPLITMFRHGPEPWRQPALWSALGLGLYVISTLIVDGFQGTAETSGGLPGTAQGQVIVSSLWALSGLVLIVTGLRRHRPHWRKAGLILLVLSMLKITLYDLASLNAAGRTISFILVGLVLLAAAFAYQWVSRQERQPG